MPDSSPTTPLVTDRGTRVVPYLDPDLEPPEPLDRGLCHLGVNLVQSAEKDCNSALVQTVRTALELIDVRREMRAAIAETGEQVREALRDQQAEYRRNVVHQSAVALMARRGYLGDPEDPDVETRVPPEVLRVLRQVADARRVSSNQLMRDVLIEWAAAHRKADQ